jgi:hypothetical protein
MLAVLLSFAATSPVAHAGSSNVSPDPAPHARSSSGGGNPAPDPSPQATPSSSAVSAAPPQPVAPVVPRPTSSGIGVISSAQSGGSTTTTATTAIQPSVPVRRSIRRTVHHARHRAAWVATVARQVTTPWHVDPLLAGAAVSTQPTAPQRNGLLLLLGSAAMAVLALASASMLRLLRRMDEVRPS